LSRSYFICLRPNFEASKDEIDAFETYLAERQAIPADKMGDGEPRLKKWLVETIQDLKEKNSSRRISAEWLEK